MAALFKRVLSFFTTVLVIGVAALALLLVGVRLTGLQVYTVLSGSMEPAFPTGSLIYVKKVDPFTLQSGDVITFMLNEETIATHRIVDVVPDESDHGTIRFRTKGDANESEDGQLVHYKNILGSPVFTIPFLGYAASYIQRPPGMYYAIAGGIVLLLLTFIPDLLADEEDRKPRRKRAAAHVKK